MWLCVVKHIFHFVQWGAAGSIRAPTNDCCLYLPLVKVGVSAGRGNLHRPKKWQPQAAKVQPSNGPVHGAWGLLLLTVESFSNVGESFSKNHGIPAIAAPGGEIERMQVDVLQIGGTGNSTSGSLLIDWVESSQETLNKLASLLVSVSWRLSGLSGFGRDGWRKENAAYSLWRSPVDSINHGHFMMFW